MHHSRAIPFALLIALCASSFVRADISDDDLAALGDKEFAKRHAATQKLLTDNTVTPQQIAAAYKKATKAEQRHRLLSIARHHVLRRLREQLFNENDRLGALGLTHASVLPEQLPALEGRAAMRVRETLPGFPAHGRLEAGDLILAIDAAPMPVGMSDAQLSTHFGDLIQRKGAGRDVEFSVRRGDKTVTVTVPLASREALNNMYLQPGLLQDRFRLNWIRFRASMTGEEDE